MAADGEGPEEMPVSALLWDLDNVAPGLTRLSQVGEALSLLVEPRAPRIASAHTGVMRTCRTTLEGLGIRALSGGRRPDGADLVLLRQAKRAARAGVRRFVVASNDRAFARLAALGSLCVVTQDVHYVSNRLLSAADEVILLGSDGRVTPSTPESRSPVGSAVQGKSKPLDAIAGPFDVGRQIHPL